MTHRKTAKIAILASLWLIAAAGAAFPQNTHPQNYAQNDAGLEQQIQTKQKEYEYFRMAANKCADEEENSPSENLNDLGSECYDDNMVRAYAAQRDIAELEDALKQEKCPGHCLNGRRQKNCPSYCR